MTPEQQRTLELAEQAIGLSDPNPRVGCVLRTPSGQVVEGYTQAAGGLHAEAHALAQARSLGLALDGATAWVSLEPCSHHGRTPPCCQALIDAGLRRVHVAGIDPNPLVAGQGVAALRAAGVEVLVDDGDWALEARALNIGFMSRMERGRPWVRMKVAASLDGCTALPNGTSQWITGPAARADGHAWRRRAGAILTGIGTVRDDNPRLDVRLVPTVRQPLRVVVDSALQISPAARVLASPGRCLVYTTESQASPSVQALQALGTVEVVTLPTDEPLPGAAADAGNSGVPDQGPTDTQGRGQAQGRPSHKTDLKFLMRDLAARGINELHVEAGHKLNGSLLRAGLVDELLVYLAPKMLGAGLGMAAVFNPPLESLEGHFPLRFLEHTLVDGDLRIRALTTAGVQAWAPPR